MRLLEFIFSNFFTWLGFMALIAVAGTWLYGLYSRWLRHRIIKKHGYPPAHCDADGHPSHASYEYMEN